MPTRNRVIFQSEAVFIGPSPSTGAHMGSGQVFSNTYGNLTLQTQTTGASGLANGNGTLVDWLTRVQSCNYSLQIPRTDINQFGELAAIDRIILQQPTVSLDLSYLLANFSNENNIGMYVTKTGNIEMVSCISGFLSKLTDEHNIFVVDAAEGADVNNASSINNSQANTYAFGNMFLSSYNSQGSVGNLPTVDLRFEGLNMMVQSGTQNNSIPAVFPSNGDRVTGWFYQLPIPQSNANPGSGDLTISALRPGDMTLTIFNSGTSVEYAALGASPSPINGAVQGYRIGVTLGREDLLKLGSKFAYSKEIKFPVTVSFSVNGLVRDVTTGDLSTVICADNPYDVELAIKKPGCETNRPVIARYKILGAKLDGQSYSLGIGSNKTFTLDFSSQIGSSTQGVGLFMSGLVGN